MRYFTLGQQETQRIKLSESQRLSQNDKAEDFQKEAL